MDKPKYYVGPPSVIDNYGNWEDAQNQLDFIDFDPSGGIDVSLNTSHRHGPLKVHYLETYKVFLPDILGYETMGRYDFCPDCDKVWAKFAVMFNLRDNCCYQKWFIRHGKYV